MDYDRPNLESWLTPWNGCDASDRVEEWIHEAVEYLQRNPKKKDTHILSGDTRVDVRRTEFGLACRFEVMVSKICKQGHLPENVRAAPYEPWNIPPAKEDE